MNINHLEINFQRLLVKCEELAEERDSQNWRFEKYVLSLEEMLEQLNKLTVNKPSQDMLKTYSKRWYFLKQLTVLYAQPINTENLDHQPKLNNPGPIMTNKDLKPKQIYQKVQLNQENTLRQQLLANRDATNKHDSSDIENVDMNKLISQQQENQEKLAQEMLKSVEAIKNNSLVARRIVSTDNNVLDKLDVEADKNSKNLAWTSGRLAERVSKSCNCWIWLMIFLILVVFVMMVLFMKLFPKQKYAENSIGLDHDSETYTHFKNNNTMVMGNETIHSIEL